MVDVRPCSVKLILLREWLDYMKFKRRMQDIIHDFIDLLICSAHSLQVNTIIVADLCLCHFFIPLGQDIIWVLK
jgi:hypothetical protein